MPEKGKGKDDRARRGKGLQAHTIEATPAETHLVENNNVEDMWILALACTKLEHVMMKIVNSTSFTRNITT